MLSSAQKQGSSDLSNRSRMTIPLHFKSSGWLEKVLSFFLFLMSFACAPQKLPKLPFRVQYIKGLRREVEKDFSTWPFLTGQGAMFYTEIDLDWTEDIF